MKLTVENFGPIREAKNIEVKPMTVFVGPSNSGKSYMAMLIYATIESLPFPSKGYIEGCIDWMFGDNQLLSDHTSALFDYTSKIISACADSSEADACRAIGEYFKSFAVAVSATWREKALHCFGEEGANLLEGASVKVSGGSPRNLEIDLTNPEASKISKKILSATYRGVKEIIDKKLQKSGLGVGASTTPERDDMAVIFNELGKTVLAFIVFNKLLNLLYGRKPQDTLKTANGNSRSRRKQVRSEVYYLPAIRGDIIQSHRIFLSALISAGTKRMTLPLFNGVLADFMEQLISIRPQPESSDKVIASVAKEIETKTLAGKIEVIPSSENGPPDFQYSFRSNGSSKELSLMNASSSVSELASVVLFIKNRLSPGDYFILEEPEAHLHPKAQREISIMLAKLVDAGVHVLITTHSDIVSEQVSNFIYAAKASDKKVQNIAEESCAIYLFDKSNTGKTKVKNVPFDLEDGYVTEDHMKVHSDLYNETASLISSVSRQVHDGD